MPESVFIDSLTNLGIAGVLAYIVYFQIKGAKETSDKTLKQQNEATKIQEKHLEILVKIVDRLDNQNVKLDNHNKLLEEFKKNITANTSVAKSTDKSLKEHNEWSKRILEEHFKLKSKKLKKIST